MSDKELQDRINNIIRDRSFNELPFEQRKFICRFLQQHQILTLYQAMTNYPDLVCGAYKAKIRNWIENCVDDYEKEYGTPKERGDEKPRITCLNCKHLMFSDMYGECNKQLRIVNPGDTCEFAEPKERGCEK